MSKNSLIAIAAVAVVAVIVVAGVAFLPHNGNDSDDRETVTITDLAGRDVEVKVPVKRIVCGDAEAMTLIAAIAGEDFKEELVGYDSNVLSYYPDVAEMWKDSGLDLDKIEAVGSLQDMSFSWETVASLNPDVVFIPMWVYVYGMVSTETVQQMADAGISIVNLDLYVDTFNSATMKKNCDILGTLFGNETVADKVSDFYTEQINAVFDKKNQITANKYSFYAELVSKLNAYAGAGNLRDILPLEQNYIMQGKSGQVISSEAFATSGVDYIFMMVYNGTSECGENIGWGATVTTAEINTIVNSLAERPGWTSVPAVTNKKVVFFDTVLYNTNDNWFILQLFAKTMFSDIYGSLNPVASLDEFYDEFLPWVNMKGVWYFTMDGEIGASS